MTAASKKVRFTAGRVLGFACEPGKNQCFLWDSGAPGLGLRATRTGKKYIFQAKLGRDVIRMTIGDPITWTIPLAQAEARRLKLIVDSGQDPRKLQVEEAKREQTNREINEKAAEARRIKEERESATVGEVWPQYIQDRIETRKGGWSRHHIDAHRKMMQPGGLPQKRGQKRTKAGPLWPLANRRLLDLTTECVEDWAKQEAKSRPSSARLAYRLLKAFLNWCAEHDTYSALVAKNPTNSKRTRESLGKPRSRHDVLQREQLAAWFKAVMAIPNPVVSAYLQSLLLVGPRRNELTELRWAHADFQWRTMRLKDKIEGERTVPMTPYVAYLLSCLPRSNEWVYSSLRSQTGHIVEPRYAHNQALAAAGLPHLTLQGLRRSFATLSEWIEVPAGISAQVQGHAPQGVREQNYIRRPLDLLRLWHTRIEEWILAQAGVVFVPEPDNIPLVIAEVPR